jgi:hypothetical protein
VSASVANFEHYEDARHPNFYFVIPAKAGIHWLLTAEKWIPAFAGMTSVFSRE